MVRNKPGSHFNGREIHHTNGTIFTDSVQYDVYQYKPVDSAEAAASLEGADSSRTPHLDPWGREECHAPSSVPRDLVRGQGWRVASSGQAGHAALAGQSRGRARGGGHYMK